MNDIELEIIKTNEISIILEPNNLEEKGYYEAVKGDGLQKWSKDDYSLFHSIYAYDISSCIFVIRKEINYVLLIEVVKTILLKIREEEIYKLNIDLRWTNLNPNIVLNIIANIIKTYLYGKHIELNFKTTGNFIYVSDEEYEQLIKDQPLSNEFKLNYSYKQTRKLLEFKINENTNYTLYSLFIEIYNFKYGYYPDIDKVNNIFSNALIDSKTKHKIVNDLVKKPNYNLIIQLGISAELKLDHIELLLDFTNQTFSSFNKKDQFLIQVIKSDYKDININNLNKNLKERNFEPIVAYGEKKKGK